MNSQTNTPIETLWINKKEEEALFNLEYYYIEDIIDNPVPKEDFPSLYEELENLN